VKIDLLWVVVIAIVAYEFGIAHELQALHPTAAGLFPSAAGAAATAAYATSSPAATSPAAAAGVNVQGSSAFQP
jgi:hypothetical protein